MWGDVGCVMRCDEAQWRCDVGVMRVLRSSCLPRRHFSAKSSSYSSPARSWYDEGVMRVGPGPKSLFHQPEAQSAFPNSLTPVVCPSARSSVDLSQQPDTSQLSFWLMETTGVRSMRKAELRADGKTAPPNSLSLGTGPSGRSSVDLSPDPVGFPSFHHRSSVGLFPST